MRGPVPATPDPPDSEPPIVADRPIVLVVDDVEATCRSYRRFLGPDFDARLETSAEAATARIRRDRHDALLVDLRLVEKDIADRSGLDVIRAFRGRGERGPVLLVTGIDLGKLDVGREIIQVLDGLDAQFATKGESLPTLLGWASRVRAHALVSRLDGAGPASAIPRPSTTAASAWCARSAGRRGWPRGTSASLRADSSTSVRPRSRGSSASRRGP